MHESRKQRDSVCISVAAYFACGVASCVREVYGGHLGSYEASNRVPGITFGKHCGPTAIAKLQSLIKVSIFARGLSFLLSS